MLWKIIERHNFHNKIILDLGCGSGLRLEEILKHEPYHVIGIDCDRKILSRCSLRLNFQNLDLIEGTYEQIPLISESVDIAVSTYANFFKSNIYSRLNEIYRVLKPGGEFTIVSTAHKNFGDAENIVKTLYAQKFKDVRLTRPGGYVSIIGKK